ncbi:MAG: hypothetical protein H6677_22690 [Candidatus Obscuribacterales bacterium]|nr:hypothetical protein [Cyanobacteria bacterium HKST-UBA01]MCB9471099.1 hypothetical protein [Candidatus Obscuribacterales bacterium]
MSKKSEDKEKNAGDKMIDYLTRGVSDEDREPREGEVDLIEGYSREIAFIGEDGTICINYVGQKDYVSGGGWEQFSPDDPQYGEYCAKYGLEKPGDSKCILRRLVDGEWVEIDDKQDQAN